MIVMFLLALIVSGGLLYYQWNEKEVLAVKDYDVSAKLTYANSQLSIEQTFKNLEVEKVVLQIPKQAIEVSARYEDGEEIEFVNSNQLLTFQLKKPNFILGYKYAYYEPGNVHLLPAPFFYLNKDSSGSMDLSIYDQSHQYSWIFDGELLGSTARDDFSLTMYWDGSLKNDTYLTKGDMRLAYEQDGVKLFASEAVKNYRFKSMLEKIKPYGLVSDGLTIIVDEYTNKNLIGEQTLVIPNQKNAKSMEYALAQSLLAMQYRFDSKTKASIVNFLTSYMLKETPADRKLAAMYKYLTENITSDEQENWLSAVLSDTKTTITPAKLDEIFYMVTNKPTTYFSMNFAKKSYVPFFESLDLKLTYRKQEWDFTGILYNGRVYYPMDIFTALKFKVNELNTTRMQLTYKGDTWDLRTDRNVFQFNNEYLEISRPPISRIAGDLYIEQYWLAELFQVRIVEVGNQGEVLFNP